MGRGNDYFAIVPERLRLKSLCESAGFFIIFGRAIVAMARALAAIRVLPVLNAIGLRSVDSRHYTCYGSEERYRCPIFYYLYNSMSLEPTINLLPYMILLCSR